MSRSDENPIAIIGRGHSGTRILSYTLYSSGVHMGRWLGVAGDKAPAKDMFAACRIIARHVEWKGGLTWDFTPLHSTPIDAEFTERIDAFLEDVLTADRPQRGWKLPETTLAYPWLVRMLPNARFVYIVRDPRDCLLGSHQTDDLGKFDVPCPQTDDVLDRRVASWKYQYDIVKSTPEPANFISLRYEDLVLDREATLQRLEGFLGIPLSRVVVDRTRIGRWKTDRAILAHLDPLEAEMRECGYV